MNFKGFYEPAFHSSNYRFVSKQRPTMPLEGHCPKIEDQS